VDDNPVDCADVHINCPGVLTLQLPRDAESFPAFLDHVWAFDQAGATAEDHNRTQLYQENAKREEFREPALSLKDFVKGLELRVVRDHKRLVELAYRPTEKNAPVREFMKSIRNLADSETGTSWTFAADRLASLAYNPDEAVQHEEEAPAPPVPNARPPRQGWGFGVAERSEPVQRIAEGLCDIERLGKAIEAYRL